MSQLLTGSNYAVDSSRVDSTSPHGEGNVSWAPKERLGLPNSQLALATFYVDEVIGLQMR